MGAVDMVRSLMAEGVEFATDGERIRWRYAGGRMTPERVAELTAAKPEVIAFLSRQNAPPHDTADDALDRYEERAAIREHDAGQPRTEAEAAALAEAARAAGMAPGALLRLWAEHPDAQTLMALLHRDGPQTYGAAGSILGWGMGRAWQADARLRAAGLVRYDGLGRAVPVAGAELDTTGAGGAPG